MGSVVFVGYSSSGPQKGDIEGANNDETARRGVDWGLFRNIVYAWIVTSKYFILFLMGKLSEKNFMTKQELPSTR